MIDKTKDLSDKVEAAIRAAAITAIERAKQTNTPVIVWEDGRIKEIPAGQLQDTVASNCKRLGDTDH